MNKLPSQLFVDLIVEPNLPLQTHQARLASVSKRFAAMLAPLKTKRREEARDAFRSFSFPSAAQLIVTHDEIYVYPPDRFEGLNNGIYMELTLQTDFIQLRIIESLAGEFAPNRDADLRIVVVGGGRITVSGTWNLYVVQEQLLILAPDLQAFVDGALRGDAPFVY